MDIRFVTAGSGDVVAVMATDGGDLLAAGKALDTAAGGRIAKAMKAANFKGGAGQFTDILAPGGVDCARVLVTDSRSREVILATLQPGDYIGEMSLIDREPHSASVEAEVQTDALVLAGDDFTRCMLENSSTMSAVLRGLVSRLRSADRKIESLALMGVYGRVANVLLESGVPGEGNVRIIRDKISRQDIAKMVGASREMVSRVMKDFEEQGFIETRNDGAIWVKERRKVPR